MIRVVRYTMWPVLRARAADTPWSGCRRDAMGVPRDDSEAVHRFAQTGDETAFDEIVRRYQHRVFRLALSVLGPGADADAEDVAQETFLRAHRHITSYRGLGQFGTWLYRITFNLAVERRRLARWTKPHLGEEALERMRSAGQTEDPFTLAASAERARAIAEVLDRLPDAARTILHLHYWLDSSVEEIAEMLRMRPGTVKSWLHRGRQRVHAALQARGIDHEI